VRGSDSDLKILKLGVKSVRWFFPVFVREIFGYLL
jgi:hypothetical protein